MSAYPKPRNPYAGAAPLDHRPLSAIAATAGGGVPQLRIKRVLAELVPQLQALYEDGRIGGHISVHTVGLDELGRAHLMRAGLAAKGSAHLPVPEPGYTAPELYAAGAHWPRGAWTDIYGLSAVAYALVTGKPPQSAADRLESDQYQPLADQDFSKYEREFLQAIDHGLALDPANRPHSLGQYTVMMAFPEAPAAEREPPPAPPSHGPAPLVETEPPRMSARAVAFLALLLAGCVALGVYWWDRLAGGGVVITQSAPAPAVKLPSQSIPEPTPATPVAEIPPPSSSLSTPDDAYAPAAQEGGDGDADKPAASTENKAKPLPVLVSLNIRPWGEVWINGRRRGVTPPLKSLRLAPGRYSVEIRNAQLPPYRTTITVRAGRPSVITHQFQ